MRSTALCTLLLTLISVGCTRPQESREADLPSEVRSEPVLNSDDDASTIVSKAVKAHGGEESFARWSCGYLKYKTQGGMIPAQVGEVTVEDTFQLPGHFKRVGRLAAGGPDSPMVFVVNYGKGWTKKGNSPAEPLQNNCTDQIEHLFAGFCKVSALAEAGVRLTRLGAEDVNGKEAIGIRVESDELGPRDYYFGSQSGLLLKSVKTLPGADPTQRSVVEAYLDDYRDAQGTQVPMRIKGVQDGKVIIDVQLIDARFTDGFEAGTFAKP